VILPSGERDQACHFSTLRWARNHLTGGGSSAFAGFYLPNLHAAMARCMVLIALSLSDKCTSSVPALRLELEQPIARRADARICGGSTSRIGR
jgi:hypothetical protein